MRRLSLLFSLFMALVACGKQSGEGGSDPAPGDMASKSRPLPAARSGPLPLVKRAPRPKVKRLWVINPLGQRNVHWVAPGDVVRVFRGKDAAPLLLRYNGEPELQWTVDDHVVRVNGKVVGLDLSGLSVDEAAALLRKHRATAYTVATTDKSRQGIRALAALGTLSAPRILLSLQPPYLVKKAFQQLVRLKGRVEGLCLEKGYDAAELLSALPDLPGLRYLHLGDADVAAKDLPRLRRFARLTQLHLELDSDVGGRLFTELRQLRHLRRLSLQDGKTTAPDAARLKDLSGLRVLRWRRGPSEHWVGVAAQLPELEVLGLGWGLRNQDLKPLAGLQKLRVLELNAFKVTGDGLKWLRGLTALHHLDINGVKVDDAGLAHLAGLTELRVLEVSSRLITGSGLVHLKGLKKLDYLDLSQTQVRGEGLGHLAGLSELTLLGLNWTKVGDKALALLAPLKKLQGLTLADTAVGDAGFAKLHGAALRFVNLTKTLVGDAGLKALAQARHLRFLNLHRTKVGDAGVAHLKQSTELRYLNLSTTRVTDKGLETLGQLTRLEHLVLGDLPVTDAGLARLRGLKRLKLLYLSNTRVTDAGLAHLSGMQGLEELYLRGTRVSDNGLQQLGKLQRLRELNALFTGVTKTGAAAFKKSHPRCKVSQHVR